MTAAVAPRETRAVLRYYRASAFKARPVLDLIRGKSVAEARNILSLSTRGFAEPILKLLNSAVANAEHNDQLPADELFVAVAMADEGPTMRRFRARARGRGSRIRKRTCHITITVQRYSDEVLERKARAEATTGGASRSRRVAQSRAAAAGSSDVDTSSAPQEVVTDEPDESPEPSDQVLEADVAPSEDDVPKVEDEEGATSVTEEASSTAAADSPDDETKDA